MVEKNADNASRPDTVITTTQTTMQQPCLKPDGALTLGEPSNKLRVNLKKKIRYMLANSL